MLESERLILGLHQKHLVNQTKKRALYAILRSCL